MRRTRICSAVVALLSATTLLLRAVPARAVSEGNLDSGSPPLFPFVVHITTNDEFDPNTQRLCSGVLISPAFVLAAGHCVKGQRTCGGAAGSYSGFASAQVRLAFQAIEPPEASHNAELSGFIQMPNGFPLDPCSGAQTAQDIALYQLDTRIRLSKVQPLHPPTADAALCAQAGFTLPAMPVVTVPTCRGLVGPIPYSFTGTLVGYGPTNMWTYKTEDNKGALYTWTPQRNWRTDSGWGESAVSSDGISAYYYQNSWFWRTTPAFCPVTPVARSSCRTARFLSSAASPARRIPTLQTSLPLCSPASLPSPGSPAPPQGSTRLTTSVSS